MIEKIDIIICTKNRLSELEKTISIMCSHGFIQDQFYITDDASTDNTFSIVKLKYPKINLLRNDESMSLTYNRSRMMTLSKRDFVLSIDDDSHIRSKEDIEEAITILQSQKNYGIFHFHVFNQLKDPIEKAGLTNKIYKVKSYIGCGHIIKRAVIQKIGTYFQELVFYEEEIDYSLRAFKAGYFVVTNENLVVHHRIDQKIRSQQKINNNDIGVFGYYWRVKMHSSNRLIIPIIHYPIGIDLFYFFVRFVRIFYRTVFIDKKIRLFFVVLARVFNLRKHIIKNVNKLSYSQFREWNKLPHYPSSGS